MTNFNTYMAGITVFNFHQDNGCIGFIILILKKHLKRRRVQVSIPFIAKDIAIIRLSVTGGGHLELSHEKLDKKRKQFVSCRLGSIYVKNTII